MEFVKKAIKRTDRTQHEDFSSNLDRKNCYNRLGKMGSTCWSLLRS